MVNTKRDYYETLGISRNANQKDIKKAYKKMALKYHPDKAINTGLDPKKAEEKFKEIGEAYSILSDDEKRAAYDRYGHNAFQAGGMPGGVSGFHTNFDGFDPFSIFEEFFKGVSGGSRGDPFSSMGGGRSRGNEGNPFAQTFKTRTPAGPEKGEDVELLVKIPRNEARAKITKTIKRGGEKIKIKIPSTIKNGQKLKVGGKGKSGKRGGKPGDLYIVVNLVEPSVDKMEVFISPFEAILGVKKTIETSQGDKITVNILSGTQPGEKVTMTERGSEIGSSKQKRDIILTIRIKIPPKSEFSKEQLAFLEQINDQNKN